MQAPQKEKKKKGEHPYDCGAAVGEVLLTRGVWPVLARKLLLNLNLFVRLSLCSGARLKLDIRGQQKNCATMRNNTPQCTEIRANIRTHLYLLYLLYQHNLQGPPVLFHTNGCCNIANANS